jgi:ADP-ribosyl-[dinitrogen reductase] hydrolase
MRSSRAMQTPDVVQETPLSPTELYEGVLLGTAIGDALGLACEALSAGVIAKRFGRVDRYRLFASVGWVSDDTEQSALVAQSIVRSRGEIEACVRVFRRALVGWFWRLPWGIGLATLRACLKLSIGLRSSGVNSAGNGAAMRSAILGAFHRHDQMRRREAARAIASVTHGDPRAVEGAVFVADVVAMRGGARARLESARARLEEPRLAIVIDRALALAEKGARFEDAAEILGTTGFVEHTLGMATFAFASRGGGPMEQLLPAVIAVGGDTDSIGAIVGAWFGALHGPSGLPAAWRGALQRGPFGAAHLEALARDLAAIERGVDVPRPARFSWPLAMARNLALYPIVLAHGLRRLAPPYG